MFLLSVLLPHWVRAIRPAYRNVVVLSTNHLNHGVAVSHLRNDKPHVTISTNVALPKEHTLEESQSATRA